jgi:outer membrane protein assembly factor BamB
MTTIGMLRNLCVPLLAASAGVSAQQALWEAAPGFRDFGAIAVSGGVVLTGNITGKGGTFAFDLQTGKLLWKLPGQMRNGPAAAAGRGFTVNDAGSDNYRLNAFDLKTGKVLWSKESPRFWSDSDLLLDSGRLYFAANDGKARAFDAATGALAWEFPFSPGRGNCPTTMAAAGGLVYFGGGEFPSNNSQGVFLWALDAGTGKEVWRFASKPDSWSRIGECVTAPAVAGGLVTVSGSNILYALDAGTGALRWKREVRRNVEGRDRARTLSPPYIAGGQVYAIFEEGLTGWNLRDGSPAFEFPGHFPPEQSIRRIASADGLLYFTANFEQPEADGNRQGFLYALDPATKRVTWKHRVNRESQYHDPTTWPTRYFTLTGGALLYENYGLIAKITR